MLKKDYSTCPHCGSKEIGYLGWDDGGGDDGESVVETFKCMECSAYLERTDFDWIETEDEE